MNPNTEKEFGWGRKEGKGSEGRERGELTDR